MINKYKIKVFGLVVELEFMAGSLKSITFKEPANDSNAMRLFAQLHGTEADIIKRIEQIDSKVFKIKKITPKQKIAIWKEVYKIHFGESYKGYFSENKIKNVNFTQDLIVAFFKSTEWYAKSNNINQYANNYNDIKQKYLAKDSKAQEANTGGAGLLEEIKKRGS